MTRGATPAAAELFHAAQEILAGVDVFEPELPRDAVKALHARLEVFQNTLQRQQWTDVRIIHNWPLFLVESGLCLYLDPQSQPSDGYRLAASYCAHFDPRFGNGLNGPSVDRIEEIAGFVVALESHEKTG